jgi:hypothetical protein
VLNFMTLSAGQKLKLRDGRIGEVVENIGDGIWAQVRFAGPDGAYDAGDEGELVHCEEVIGLAEPA